MPTSDLPLSLYVHIPWCIAKCPYCDFNSYGIQAHPLQEQAYVDALLADLKQDAHLAQGRPLRSIFFGGGTPSLFSAQSIERILNAVQQALVFDKGIEITLEANPGTFEYQKFQDFVHAGINRISLGVQSFNDDQLKRLGRVHRAREVHEAIEALHHSSLKSFNIDLMYGLPQQTLDEAMQDLEQACAYQPKHLSWYHLTMEPNTVFYRNPPANIPDDDAVIDMEEAGHALLASHQLNRYEVSAYAQPGFESKHNLNYWEFGDYLALGAGAHGKITQKETGIITRYCKQKTPRNYMNADLPFTSNETILLADDLPLEFMLNALRLSDGVPLAYFTQRTGLSDTVLNGPLQKAIAQGLMKSDQGRLCTTDKGAQFLNDVVNFFA